MPRIDSFPADFLTPTVEYFDPLMTVLVPGAYTVRGDMGWAAYLYGAASGVPNVAVCFTRDRGQTWERKGDFFYTPTGLFFLDESVGIAVGVLDLRERYADDTRFLVYFQYTTDGGLTWTNYFTADFIPDESTASNLGALSEALFPLAEFPRYADFCRAARSISLEPIDESSVKLVFCYEQNGETLSQAAVFSKDGLVGADGTKLPHPFS
ncbi:MAG: exo-alpha-sialidase [Clostridia bacterium]|nr:exo-alpha-sialidase [Clostridia bacterium]